MNPDVVKRLEKRIEEGVIKAKRHLRVVTPEGQECFCFLGLIADEYMKEHPSTYKWEDMDVTDDMTNAVNAPIGTVFAISTDQSVVAVSQLTDDIAKWAGFKENDGWFREYYEDQEIANNPSKYGKGKAIFHGPDILNDCDIKEFSLKEILEIAEKRSY